MHPVPEWLIHAALPKPGEVHLEFWGPASAKEHGHLSAGYVVLSTQRFLFVRAAGRRHTDVALQFDLPLSDISRVGATAHGVEVQLKINHLEFRIIAPADQNAAALAREMLETILRVRDERNTEIKRELTGKVDGAVHRGVPKLACRYCGTIFDPSLTKCPSCGAPRRA